MYVSNGKAHMQERIYITQYLIHVNFYRAKCKNYAIVCQNNRRKGVTLKVYPFLESLLQLNSFHVAIFSVRVLDCVLKRAWVNVTNFRPLKTCIYNTF